MTLSDMIATAAAILSAMSVVVFLWAAFRANKFSNYQIRLSNRTELHKMLLEVYRELLQHPRLYAMFKSCPATFPDSADPSEVARQDTYVVMYLNVFELAFVQFKEIEGLRSSEKEVSKAWDRFIAIFFDDCLRAREAWARHRETYYPSFRDYIDGLIAPLDASERSMPAKPAGSAWQGSEASRERQ